MSPRRRIALVSLTAASLALTAAVAFSQRAPRAARPATKPAAGAKPAKRAASATRPATRPATKPTAKTDKSPKSLTADEMLSRMLKPPAAGASAAARPLPPVPDPPAEDQTSGEGAVAPAAPSVALLKEGTFIVDRLGRMSRTRDGTWEFVFESDGSALQDPPMRLLPNLKAMQMEEMAAGADRDRRFRVTGSVTEYRGRNYLLLEKVLIVPDAVEQF